MPQYYVRNLKYGTGQTFKIIGSKWKAQILNICYHDQGATYTELKQKLNGITDATLSRKLKSLLNDSILERKLEEHSIFVLTNRAKDILPIMSMMQTFAYDCGYEFSEFNSTVEFITKLIGNKWKSKIIWVIYNSHIIRFNALLNSIEGISHKVLIELLNDLIRNDFVNKRVYNEKIPKVEYFLTDKGIHAYEIIQATASWCFKYNLIFLYDPVIS